MIGWRNAAIVPPLQDVISSGLPEFIPEKIVNFPLFHASPVPRVLVMVDTLQHIFLHPQTGLVDVRDHKVHLNIRDIALDQRRLIIFLAVLSLYLMFCM